MEQVACYNCRKTQSSHYASENGFTLVKCCACGLLYVNPRPSTEAINEAHKLGVHRGAETIGTTGHYNFSKISMYKKILADLYGQPAAFSGKKWLDIGCGYGEFLLALKGFSKNGIIARGAEPNLRKLAADRRRGLDVGDFDLSSHEGQYDVVSLLNVYSHLPDPVSSIASWKQLLLPGGEILIQTGDTADLPLELHPKPLYLPDHLSFASERILTRILEESGFCVIGVHKYPEVWMSASSALRESIKVLVPGRRSGLLKLLQRKVLKSDMYVRARLIK